LNLLFENCKIGCWGVGWMEWRRRERLPAIICLAIGWGIKITLHGKYIRGKSHMIKNHPDIFQEGGIKITLYGQNQIPRN
jgi:hypothetical protein